MKENTYIYHVYIKQTVESAYGSKFETTKPFVYRTNAVVNFYQLTRETLTYIHLKHHCLMKTDNKNPGICPFSEVACHYYPKSTQNAAMRSLRKYIEKHEKLRLELEEAGYSKKERYLTPKQIRILSDHLDPQ